MQTKRNLAVEEYFHTNNVDFETVLMEMFLAYKFRKRNGMLYSKEAEIPTRLIKLYYLYFNDIIHYDNMKKAFVTRYCNNESKIEGVDLDNHHGKEEVKGLKLMYEYIHSGEIDSIIDKKNISWGQKRNLLPTSAITNYHESSALRDAILASTGTEFALLELHGILFSCTDHPEAGYYIRNDDRYLPETGIEITEWSMIGSNLKYLDFKTQELITRAKKIKENPNPEELLTYLDDCVELNCKLIKVHPFQDGNGRTIRAFTNKLFEDAGLPPIYIKPNERLDYQKAMHDALADGDYSTIKAFYRYKICDSIIELDINDRIKYGTVYDEPVQENSGKTK